MKQLSLAVVFLIAALVSIVARGEQAAPTPAMKCDFGPITKTYGTTPWLVYSCDDGRYVLIVAAPKSPAAPFMFRFAARDDGYVLQSQGTGDKELTRAAFGELKVMTVEDVEALDTLVKTSVSQ